jgi:hypothetical protein
LNSNAKKYHLISQLENAGQFLGKPCLPILPIILDSFNDTYIRSPFITPEDVKVYPPFSCFFLFEFKIFNCSSFYKWKLGSGTDLQIG